MFEQRGRRCELASDGDEEEYGGVSLPAMAMRKYGGITLPAMGMGRSMLIMI